MEGLKATVAEYVRSRFRDRIALVVFGNTAYLQSPLTSDTTLVEELVKSIQPRMAGDGTAIGDALGLALKRLREVIEGTKAIMPSRAEPKRRNSIVIDGIFFERGRTGIFRVWDALLKEWSTKPFAERIVVLDRSGHAPRYPGIRYRLLPRAETSRNEEESAI